MYAAVSSGRKPLPLWGVLLSPVPMGVLVSPFHHSSPVAAAEKVVGAPSDIRIRLGMRGTVWPLISAVVEAASASISSPPYSPAWMFV